MDKVQAPNGGEKIGKVTRREYESLKRRAMKFEAKNRKFILVLPCDGEQDWCEMCEASALIYKYEVCEKIGAKVTMTDDQDSFYLQYEIGRIRTRGYDMVRRRIQKAGLYLREMLKDRCMVFELNVNFTAAELKKMREEEERRQAELSNIVKTHFSDPSLHQKIMLVATRLHRICYRRMDKLSSSTNGRRIVELINMVGRMYYDLAMLEKTHEQKVETWRKMSECTRQLLVEVQLVAGMKLWTREVCAKVGEEIIDLDDRIKWNLKRETKKPGSRNNKNGNSRNQAVAA